MHISTTFKPTFQIYFSKGYELTNARLRRDQPSATKWPTLRGYEMARLRSDHWV